VAQVLKRFPALGRGRLVVSGEMANDQMCLKVEVAHPSPDLAQQLGDAVREVTKLRATIEWAEWNSLPNDGKVIEDARSYR